MIPVNKAMMLNAEGWGKMVENGKLVRLWWVEWCDSWLEKKSGDLENGDCHTQKQQTLKQTLNLQLNFKQATANKRKEFRQSAKMSLVRTSSKSAARRRLRRHAGSWLSCWTQQEGLIHRKGPAPVQSMSWMCSLITAFFSGDVRYARPQTGALTSTEMEWLVTVVIPNWTVQLPFGRTEWPLQTYTVNPQVNTCCCKNMDIIIQNNIASDSGKTASFMVHPTDILQTLSYQIQRTVKVREMYYSRG